MAYAALLEMQDMWKAGKRCVHGYKEKLHMCAENTHHAYACWAELCITQYMDDPMHAWPLCSTDALQMLSVKENLDDDAPPRHSLLYMLVYVSILNKSALSVLQKLLSSPALHVEAVAQEMIPLSAVAYSSAPAVWELWAAYMRSPCWYRLRLQTFQSLDFVASVARAHAPLSVFASLVEEMLLPLEEDESLLQLLIHVGVLAMKDNRDDVGDVVKVFQNALNVVTSCAMLTNVVGTVLLDNLYRVDIWLYVYRFLYAARVPIRWTETTVRTRTLYIIDRYHSTLENKLLEATLRRLTDHYWRRDKHLHPEGKAFAQLVLSVYFSGSFIFKFMDYIVNMVTDLDTIEYLFSLNINFCMQYQHHANSAIVRLAMTCMATGHEDVLDHIATLPQALPATNLMIRKLPASLALRIQKHVQWCKSSRFAWLKALAI